MKIGRRGGNREKKGKASKRKIFNSNRALINITSILQSARIIFSTGKVVTRTRTKFRSKDTQQYQ